MVWAYRVYFCDNLKRLSYRAGFSNLGDIAHPRVISTVGWAMSNWTVYFCFIFILFYLFFLSTLNLTIKLNYIYIVSRNLWRVVMIFKRMYKKIIFVYRPHSSQLKQFSLSPVNNLPKSGDRKNLQKRSFIFVICFLMKLLITYAASWQR